MNRKRAGMIGIASAAVAIAAAAMAAPGCSSNPVNVPLRTFQSAQKMDVVCLKILEPDPANPGFYRNVVPPVPLPQDQCAPVPPNTDTTTLPNHLFALVTQLTHGELAVVDLTGGSVIDEDRSKPGINFVPVGANPSDVTVSPDGVLTFVSAAEPNKAAIYAIPNRRVLGDWQQAGEVPLQLTDLPVCALPQAARALDIVPRSGGGYDLVAVLPAANGASSKVVTIDVSPFLAGAAEVGGLPPDAAAPSPDAGAIGPGSLAPCPITAAVELSSQLPAGWTPGPQSPDGLPYQDGGSAPSLPEQATCRAAAADAGSPTPAPVDGGGSDGGAVDAGGALEAGVLDAGTLEAGAGEAGALEAGAGDGGASDAGDGGAEPLSFGPLDPPRATAAALAIDAMHPTLYVADDALPVIHVIDLTDARAPRELAPLLATSVANPARKVGVSGLAVSPVTRDFKRYLYAIDEKEGSIIVYDVTDPATSPRVPIRRAHPELNPFEAPDRITFTAPVAAVSFVKHDFPLPAGGNPTSPGGALTGILCNPNPNANANMGRAETPAPVDNSPEAQGVFYRNDVSNLSVALGPYRLRGIFGFATLSNGQVVTIDVDDWDAPCRRPDPMPPTKVTAPAGVGTTYTAVNGVATPEPPAAAGDLDPWHAPNTFPAGSGSTPVTLETFFPVSQPNRPRSGFLLRDDPTTGRHVPNLTVAPLLYDNTGASVTVGGGTKGATVPLMLPPASTLPDYARVTDPTDPVKATFTPAQTNPTKDEAAPGILFSFEDPQANHNQDWTITYEGSLPGFNGQSMLVSTTDGYVTLTLSNPNALLCRRGVEDWDVGKARVALEQADMASHGIPSPPALDQWTTDYVQIADDILPSTDPYWQSNQDCWSDKDPMQQDPQGRYNLCEQAFGSSTQTPELSVSRDFPILEAYDDHLVIGPYAYAGDTQTTANRVVAKSVPPGQSAGDPTKSLKLAQCCFHRQVSVNVRTGGEWVAVGSVDGFLSHVVKDPSTNRCVLACDARTALLNGRAPDVPRPNANSQLPGRDTALAMRNPAFSFVIWSGAAPSGADHTTTARDLQWKFSTAGQFAPLGVNIAATTMAVAPQSMRFIESLGQLAVVDGSSQGLVLIDLNQVIEAHAPYF